MLINSFKTRSIAQRDALSFEGVFSFSNVSGLSEFSLSGDSAPLLSFIFSGGRILDPEGNYTYEYTSNNQFSISANISTGSYNYSINDEYIAQYPKTNGKYDGFYFNTSDSFNVDLTIMTSGQDISYTFPTVFDTGNAFSFTLSNLTPDYNFRIFSGELKLNDGFTDSFDFQTGTFPQTVTTSTAISIRDLGGEMGVSYPFNFTLYTNQGDLTGYFSVIDNIPTYYTTFEFFNLNNSGYANFFYNSGDATDLTYTTQNGYRYGNYRLDYTIDTPSTGKVLFIELLSSGGNTGNYVAPFVTGITLTTSGEGYVSAPTIAFNGGGGTGAAATASLLGGYISSISFTSFGTGYTSVPDVSFDGGSPTYSGSGIAILSGYTKTFFNTWDILTGNSTASLSSYSSNGQTGTNRYFSNIPLSYSDNSLYLVAKARNWWDTDLNYAQLTVSGLDNNISVAIITGGYTI